jgi:hypothetical protein
MLTNDEKIKHEKNAEKRINLSFMRGSKGIKIASGHHCSAFIIQNR